MTVFIDTSAFLGVMNRNDLFAVRAGNAWRKLLMEKWELSTTAYIVVETTAILQRRIGMAAVQMFADHMLPVVEVHAVDEQLHGAAFRTTLAAGRRELSLVDCCSFEFMRRNGITTAFAYDQHFSDQGFELIGQVAEAF